MVSTLTLYGISFTGGLLSFFSPCIIPMVTVYFSLITGMSIKELKSALPAELKRRAFINTLFFVLAFTIVFTLAGGMSGKIAGFFKGNIGILNIIGGIFISLVGLNMLGILKLPSLHMNMDIPDGKLPPLGYARSFFLGLFFAIACSHCIGPTLYSFLLIAGTLSAAKQGMMLMFIFSLGLAIPYLILSVAFGKYYDSLKSLMSRGTPQKVLGAIMIIFGIMILTGNFTKITGLLSRILPYKLPIGM
ncbi:cytochrome C biogenesis protein [Biomaibacter acetigenes]|uniref:Cytochrome C biogenesis protein n=1 Tax=Biomaibacter acetigenes TaxID=2316383 RepID=A0A3G2R891_9FIRM|nr:cytochrome c biogenesis protein CcdA [Biomaibacter acetigenes]AYO31007.1 cytochrome C biogenesis protein [Biomaibacter acetigenes]